MRQELRDSFAHFVRISHFPVVFACFRGFVRVLPAPVGAIYFEKSGRKVDNNRCFTMLTGVILCVRQLKSDSERETMKPMNPETAARLASLAETRTMLLKARRAESALDDVQAPEALEELASGEWERLRVAVQDEVERRHWAFQVAKFLALRTEARRTWARSY